MSKGCSFLDEEFPNGVQRLGDGRTMENAAGVFFFIGWWNLTGSDFDYSNLFESLTQHSVNIEHQVK